MRPVQLPQGISMQDMFTGFRQIEQASMDTDLGEVVDAFTVTGPFTETYTLDPSTATASDVANVLATLFSVIHRRGKNRRDRG